MTCRPWQMPRPAVQCWLPLQPPVGRPPRGASVQVRPPASGWSCRRVPPTLASRRLCESVSDVSPCPVLKLLCWHGAQFGEVHWDVSFPRRPDHFIKALAVDLLRDLQRPRGPETR